MNTRSRAVFWVLVVFLAGATSGGAMVYLLVAPPTVSTNSPPQGGRGGGWNPDRFMQRLTEELELTPEQQASMKSIFEEQRRNFDSTFKQMRAQTHARIKEVLRPEQMAKFEEIMRERDRSRGGRGGEHPPKKQ